MAPSDFMVPASEEQVAHLAEITALRQMTDTLGRMGTFIQTLGSDLKAVNAKVGEMHVAIALMEQRNEQLDELRADVIRLAERVVAIELLHAEQAGGAKLAVKIKDWSPWLVALLTGLWALFERRPM